MTVTVEIWVMTVTVEIWVMTVTVVDIPAAYSSGS
jgi:hypothetical protein